ncbi:hypothetical protein EC973_004435 [Apophysomyces ossiformis]|uniref:Homeobox domain-containing protein n=1 Tax=Apophysomyces ossiformis TaxID=679940 RepID=A0A8H7BSU2_9FUNG|nr:hypothetical protein EC973_004435 [Apophysomyces ossiformis]
MKDESQEASHVFSPVILFHDHTYGDQERVHVAYGDPYYSPLIQIKKERIHNMLKSNGKFWTNLIQNTHTTTSMDDVDSHSSYSPPQWQRSPSLPRTPPLSERLQHEDIYLGERAWQTKMVKNEQQRVQEDEQEEEAMTVHDFSRQEPSRELSILTHHYHQQHHQHRRRGNLPKPVTAILRQWLVDHCRDPYPTEEEKNMLKAETGLTLNQISNWFINARRRILPMILVDSDSEHPTAEKGRRRGIKRRCSRLKREVKREKRIKRSTAGRVTKRVKA